MKTTTSKPSIQTLDEVLKRFLTNKTLSPSVMEKRKT